MDKEIVNVNVSDPNYYGNLNHKSIKIIGVVNLKVLSTMEHFEYDYLDISDADFGTDQEEWYVCMGWSHSGPVYGNSGYRDVEVLRRFLEKIDAKTILLPNNVQRRHINSARKNNHLKELKVTNNCTLFANEGCKLMNKKKTKPVFG